MAGLSGFLNKEFALGNWAVSLMDIIFAAGLLIFGFFLGRIVKWLLNKLVEKAGMQKTIKHSFINLFLVVIEWSIYILFINLALIPLNIPELASWISSILIFIPALVGSLLLIGIGFIIASYLKDIVEESKVLNWEILSNVLFYFVLYVFIIFALKTALLSLDNLTVNIILIIFTAVTSVSFAYRFSKKK